MTAGPTDSTTAFRRAEALLNANRPEQALATLSTALASDPENARLHAQMARAFLALDDPDEALVHCGRAVVAAPEDEWPHRLASIAFQRRNEPGPELEAATRALRLDPNAPATHRRTAFALFNNHRYAEAHAEASWTIAQMPEDAESWRLIGLIDIRERRLDDAERDTRQGLVGAPDNGRLRHQLGMIEALRGNKEAAGVHFLAAQRLDPTGTESREALVQALGTPEARIGPGVMGAAALLCFTFALGSTAVRIAVVILGAGCLGLRALLARRSLRRQPEVAEARRVARIAAGRRSKWSHVGPALVVVLLSAPCWVFAAGANLGDTIVANVAFDAGFTCCVIAGWTLARTRLTVLRSRPAPRTAWHALPGRPPTGPAAFPTPAVAHRSGPGPTAYVPRPAPLPEPRSSPVRQLIGFIVLLVVIIVLGVSMSKGPVEPAAPPILPPTVPITMPNPFPPFTSPLATTGSTMQVIGCPVADLERLEWDAALIDWHQAHPGVVPTEADLKETIHRSSLWVDWNAGPDGNPVAVPNQTC